MLAVFLCCLFAFDVTVVLRIGWFCVVMDEAGCVLSDHKVFTLFHICLEKETAGGGG